MKNQYIFGGDFSPNDPRCAHLAARESSLFGRAFVDELKWQRLHPRYRTSAAPCPSLRFRDRRAVGRIPSAVTRTNWFGDDSARQAILAYPGVLAQTHEWQSLPSKYGTPISVNPLQHISEGRIRQHIVFPDASAGCFRNSSALRSMLLPHRALLNCTNGKSAFRGIENPPQVNSPNGFNAGSLLENGANRQPLVTRAER